MLTRTDHRTGYLSPDYAASLADFGRPLELHGSGATLLARQVPGTEDEDLLAPYPLLACVDWPSLADDLEGLGNSFVSVTAVVDPFADIARSELDRAFPDLLRPFKRHTVVDLAEPSAETASPHHRKFARRASRRVAVAVEESPGAFLDEWMVLHDELVRRHRVSGLRAFSRRAFARQLALEGATLLVARDGDEAVGAQLWMSHGDAAYGHVAALSPRGYELGAGYALHWSAFEHFRSLGLRWCDLGGVPGGEDDDASGLRAFKNGWSGRTRPSYLAGRILDLARYRRIVAMSARDASDYFPAYRAGELTSADHAQAAPAGERTHESS